MPSIDEWNNALVLQRQLMINASADLALKVNSLPKSQKFEGSPKIAKGLDQFSSFQVFTITAAELLYAMGRITTPRVENLVDLCSTWARIRYIWAFDPDPRVLNLRLSDEARSIDPHQKAVLSDEIGVGMAGLILEQYFDAINPVDVSDALRSWTTPMIRKIYETAPDYIFQKPNGDYIVVECKCTMTDFSAVLRQLKRGTEQVPSLVFSSGHSPLALVIGTGLTDTATSVNIIDPPSEHSDPENDRHSTFIPNEEEFRRSLVNTQFANLFRYIGATRRAQELKPVAKSHEDVLNNDPPLTLRLSETEEEYVGIAQTFPVAGGADRIQIFQGLPRTLYQLLVEGRLQGYLEAAKTHFDKARTLMGTVSGTNREQTESLSKGAYFSDRTDQTLVVRIFGRDGTVLGIEIGA